MTFGVELIVIAVMLAINAILAAYEIAIATIPLSRINALVHEKRHGAGAALFMKERMEGSLAVVQLGITLAGSIAAAFGGAGMNEACSPWLQEHWGLREAWADALSLMFLVIPLSAFTILFGELVPKMFAIHEPERVVLALSPAMRVCTAIFSPLIRLFEGLVKLFVRALRRNTRATSGETDRTGLLELRAATTLARSTRLIGPLQERIVHAAVQMSRRVLGDIMLPVAEIATIYVEVSLADALVRAHQFMHTRFPVVERENDPGTVIGYVNFKDIVTALKINPEFPSIRSILRPIDSLSQTTNLAAALDHLTKRREHIAMVIGSNGATAGMVALEDIIEDLVGDIEDEFDRLPTHLVSTASGWIMGGGVPMHAVAHALNRPWTDVPGSRATTLAEWCESHYTTPLQGGEHLKLEDLSIHVRKVRRHRLLEGIVSPAANSPAGM